MIWGTGNRRYRLSLDPRRPWKEVGLVVDLDSYVCPFITPDDPGTVESVIRERMGRAPAAWEGERGPFL
ncbi:hypothetical protein [Streptomyces sp. NPDC001070]